MDMPRRSIRVTSVERDGAPYPPTRLPWPSCTAAGPTIAPSAAPSPAMVSHASSGAAGDTFGAAEKILMRDLTDYFAAVRAESQRADGDATRQDRVSAGGASAAEADGDLPLGLAVFVTYFRPYARFTAHEHNGVLNRMCGSVAQVASNILLLDNVPARTQTHAMHMLHIACRVNVGFASIEDSPGVLRRLAHVASAGDSSPLAVVAAIDVLGNIVVQMPATALTLGFVTQQLDVLKNVLYMHRDHADIVEKALWAISNLLYVELVPFPSTVVPLVMEFLEFHSNELNVACEVAHIMFNAFCVLADNPALETQIKEMRVLERLLLRIPVFLHHRYSTVALDAVTKAASLARDASILDLLRPHLGDIACASLPECTEHTFGAQCSFTPDPYSLESSQCALFDLAARRLPRWLGGCVSAPAGAALPLLHSTRLPYAPSLARYLEHHGMLLLYAPPRGPASLSHLSMTLVDECFGDDAVKHLTAAQQDELKLLRTCMTKSCGGLFHPHDGIFVAHASLEDADMQPRSCSWYCSWSCVPLPAEATRMKLALHFAAELVATGDIAVMREILAGLNADDRKVLEEYLLLLDNEVTSDDDEPRGAHTVDELARALEQRRGAIERALASFRGQQLQVMGLVANAGFGGQDDGEEEDHENEDDEVDDFADDFDAGIPVEYDFEN